MGTNQSSLLDEARCKFITEQAQAELKAFSPHYRKQFSVAWFSQLESNLEPQKEQMVHLLKQRESPEGCEVLYEDSLYFFDESRKWKDRYVVVRANYCLECHDSLETFLKGSPPRYKLLPTGGSVLTTEETYMAMVDECFPDENNLKEEFSPPMSGMPGQFPVYLRLPYRRDSYFCFSQQGRQMKFITILSDCIRHQNQDFLKKKTCEVQAFLKAIQLYRQDKDKYEAWDMLIGSDCRVLANLVMEQLLPSLQKEMLPHLKAKKTEKKRVWFATVEAAYILVQEHLLGGLSALKDECRKSMEKQEVLIHSDMDHIVNARQQLEEQVRAKVSVPAEKVCAESIQPHLGSVLEELMEPISSGFLEARQRIESLMDAVCQDVQQCKDDQQLKQTLALMARPELQYCYQKIASLQRKKLFGFSNMAGVIHSTQIDLQQLVENAAYTFELLVYKIIQDQPDDAASLVEKAKHRVLKQYDYDSSTVRKTNFQDALVSITLPFIKKRLAPTCKAELEGVGESVDVDYASFIHVDNVYEDVLLQTLDKEVTKVVKEAASLRRYNLFMDVRDQGGRSSPSSSSVSTPQSPAKLVLPLATSVREPQPHASSSIPNIPGGEDIGDMSTGDLRPRPHHVSVSVAAGDLQVHDSSRELFTTEAPIVTREAAEEEMSAQTREDAGRPQTLSHRQPGTASPGVRAAVPSAGQTDGRIFHTEEMAEAVEADPHQSAEDAKSAKDAKSEHLVEALVSAESTGGVEAAERTEASVSLEDLVLAEAPDSAEAPGSVEAPETAETAKSAEGGETSESVEPSVATEATEIAKLAEVLVSVEAPETAKAAEGAKTSESVETSVATEATETAKSAEAPETAKSAEGAEAPESAVAPVSAETPVSADSIESVESAQSAEAPETTETVQSAEGAKAPVLAKTSESVEASASAEATEVAKLAEAAKSAEAPVSVEAPETAETVQSAERAKAPVLAKTSESVEASVSAEAAKSAEAPVLVEAPETAETVQSAEGLKAPVLPKTSESVEASASAEATEVAKLAEAAKSAEAPVSVEAPETACDGKIYTAKSAEAAKAPESAVAPVSAKTPESVQSAKSAEGAEAPVLAKTSESVEAPETAKSAEAAEAPESAVAPVSAKTPESVESAKSGEGAKAPVLAKTSASVEAPENAETVQSAEGAKAPGLAKTSESVEAPETVQSAEVLKVPVLAKTSESVEASASAEATAIAKLAEAAKSAEAPVSVEAPESADSAETAKSANNAEAAEWPEAPLPAKTPEAPTSTEATEAAKSAEGAKAPQ
uniref:protein Niban 1a isoform X2 n=1 Tax=Doryrhamphus excisus TaxID=161450 RepID=UPI0025AEB2E2|nr:protein Niban 1a isoform X2 [Doryrhamphus excisus]